MANQSENGTLNGITSIIVHTWKKSFKKNIQQKSFNLIKLGGLYIEYINILNPKFGEIFFCKYPVPIYLAPDSLPIGAKSNGAEWLQSKFGLN